MMHSVVFLSVLIAAVTGFETSSAAQSARVAKLMSKARALGDNNNQYVDYSWVQNYSVRFQKCLSITQINTLDEKWSALTKASVATFKLCPTNQCSEKCVGGEYAVGAGFFANYYTESMMNAREYTCETIRENCNCEGYEDDSICMSNCFTKKNATFCSNFYNDNFNVQKYMECNKVKIQYNNNNNNNNKNNNNNYNNNYNNNQNNVFYAAPKCSSDGNHIHMGLYADEYCTVEADSSAYELFTMSYGTPLPYQNTDLIDENCVSCNYANNGQYGVSELCSTIYLTAAKCEANLQISSPDNTACNYISELPTKVDGYAPPKHTNWAALFFALTTFSLLGLLIYVSYKAGIVRKKIDLGARDGMMA